MKTKSSTSSLRSPATIAKLKDTTPRTWTESGPSPESRARSAAMAASLPPLTAAERAMTARLAKKQRPYVEGAIAAGAKGRPAKQLVATRLDGDVLTWLKGFGDGYSSRINRILRAVMEASQS